MADDKDAFLKKLLATFRVEASEHLETIRSALLALERATASERSQILEGVYREAHSLKGAARAVNMAEIERVCHSLESLFGGWKSKRIATSPAIFDLVHETLDLLAGLMSDSEAPRSRVDALIRALDSASKAPLSPPVVSSEPRKAPAEEHATPPPVPIATGTIRIQTTKLDSIMRETEELLGPRLAAAQRVLELRETRASLAAWKKKREAIRSNRNGGGELAELREYFEAESAFLHSLESRLAKLESAARSDHRSLSGIVDGLLRDVKESQMLPFSSLVEGLRKIVRDLARDHGKQVELVVHGSEIVIDRRILEEIKAPLQHLLRNAVDHAIEPPAVREQKGKPRQGTIAIAVSHRDNRIAIATSDDGAGIDVSKLKDAAGKLGVLSANDLESSTDEDLVPLIFQSGVSTSPVITEVSGRGLGLAIVREKVDRLGGRVSVETRRDAGTTIHIDVPLTLATFRGVLVRVGAQRFMIPAASVDRAMRVDAADVRTIQNHETISLDGRAVPLVHLGDVLELPRSTQPTLRHVQVVVLGTAGDRLAFRVDEVLSEQEVLVRGLGPQLARVRNIGGASVLGTGEVVPVLNVADLLAVRPATAVAERPVATPAAPERKSILVVEDSITSRTLLKSILETAGYDVSVAVDGIDAYTMLKTNPVDLIVSDVEMPRMDGFDLTARVRADAALAETPVVLVTALASREHRERGIDVGANAYIVKSNFDQSDLLEVVRRLI